MQSLEGLPENEKQRRVKISATMKKKNAKKREAGLRAYRKRRKKEAEARARAKKKEEERLKKEKEKEKLKNKPKRKKPGPKKNYYKRYRQKQKRKKKKPIVREKLPEFKYKIMLCRNGKRTMTIGKYRTSVEAYADFNKQRFMSDSVRFPRHISIDQMCDNSVDECILIEKTDSGPTLLRNEYGKLIEHHTNLEGWEIIDKFRYNVEETFWVWGYDNRTDRKDFNWIYNELLIMDGFGPYEFRRIFTYRNKLCVRYDDGQLEFVICKNDYDTVRLYNELQRQAKQDKVKQLIFIGDKSELTEGTKKLEAELQKITGWTLKKVRMKSSTYYVLK